MPIILVTQNIKIIKMSVALELLKELREVASQEYWCTEKESRSSIHTTLNRIDDSIREIEWWIANEEEE